MTRLHAAIFHLVVSAAVALILFSAFWVFWYPAPSFGALGVLPVFVMLLSIDVVLGPLMTFIVFKPAKKSLKFDLSVIAVLQIGAMVYGVATLLETRPVYIAYIGTGFQLVRATEVTDANLAKSGKSFGWTGPEWVGTRAPESQADKDAEEMLKTVGAGRGHLPQLHVPYESMAGELLEKAQSVQQLKALHPVLVSDIDAWLARKGYAPEAVRYQPVRIGAERFAVWLDSKTAAVLGISPFALTE